MADTTTAVRTDVETLWRDLAGWLRAFFERRTRDASEVDDLVQETFLRVHASLDGLRDDERAQAWIGRIARNVWVDARRRAEPASTVDEEVEPRAGERDPEVASVVAGWLAGTIGELDALDREVLRRHELEREPLWELADSLGLSLSAAKARVRRGREKLRRRLEACCRFEFDRRGGLVDYERRESDGCGC